MSKVKNRIITTSISIAITFSIMAMAAVTHAISKVFEDEHLMNTYKDGEALPPITNTLIQNKWIMETLGIFPLICIFLSIPLFLLKTRRSGYALISFPFIFVAPLFAGCLYEYFTYALTFGELMDRPLGLMHGGSI